jgi:hypothetical protein
MKKLIKLFFIGSLLLFYSNSYSRAIGTLINGVPSVSVTNEEFQTQLNLLSICSCGISNINLVSTSISYNPTSGGYLNLSFTCNISNEVELMKVNISKELSYDINANEFHVINGGASKTCVGKNCSSGCQPSGESCTSCTSVYDINLPSSCTLSTNDQSSCMWGCLGSIFFGWLISLFCC